ncbi:hypothetical protein RUMHYD_00181 [Blautia hydrogenotrophica DSM 10507]|uniref:Uncharacterized protein n=1 Tax=Blautia hydrogenotrophica (strain DSM 10507 / JCM 14656 / S5a33) TaxID=476272 RepID=C0CH68_BLAHS|nr:hypothetical protein RUMHYD_00181 [Blautia hydrogenotrophica DSM 10507]
MKGDLSFSEYIGVVIGADGYFSFIDAYKFPEIMCFPGKRKSAHVFKVMKRKQLLNLKFFLKGNTLIIHKRYLVFASLCCQSIDTIYLYHSLSMLKMQSENADCANEIEYKTKIFSAGYFTMISDQTKTQRTKSQ